MFWEKMIIGKLKFNKFLVRLIKKLICLGIFCLRIFCPFKCPFKLSKKCLLIVCSFIVQLHSFSSRQRDRQISSVLIIFKVIMFWEKMIIGKLKFNKFLVRLIKKLICLGIFCLRIFFPFKCPFKFSKKCLLLFGHNSVKV